MEISDKIEKGKSIEKFVNHNIKAFYSYGSFSLALEIRRKSAWNNIKYHKLRRNDFRCTTVF